jgi:hypothetical protein
MYFNSYDYQTGQLLGSFPKLNFGDIIQNQHCASPVVLKAFPNTETNIRNLFFFLVDKGPWKDTQYGFYTNPVFSVIEAGNSFFIDLIEAPLLSPPLDLGKPIHWNGTSSDYIWLDTHIHNVTGFADAKFRLFFDYD